MEHFKKLENIMRKIVKINKVEEFYKNYYKLPSYKNLISKPEYSYLMSNKYELAYKMTIKTDGDNNYIKMD